MWWSDNLWLYNTKVKGTHQALCRLLIGRSPCQRLVGYGSMSDNVWGKHPIWQTRYVVMWVQTMKIILTITNDQKITVGHSGTSTRFLMFVLLHLQWYLATLALSKYQIYDSIWSITIEVLRRKVNNIEITKGQGLHLSAILPLFVWFAYTRWNNECIIIDWVILLQIKSFTWFPWIRNKRLTRCSEDSCRVDHKWWDPLPPPLLL